MSTYEEQSGPRAYMLAASPLAVAALLGPLLEANLRDAVGEASSAQIATGVAAIPGALVAVWLTQRSRRRDAYTGRSVPTSDQVSLSKATRLLLIIAAAFGFMLVDLASCLISLGSFALAPISYYATDGEYYNAASIRAIPVFFLGCLAVATSAALRLRINVRSALVSAAIVYVVGNALQNLLLGGTLDALYLAWTLAYIVTLYVAITLGVAIARRRQSTFDADEAARANR